MISVAGECLTFVARAARVKDRSDAVIASLDQRLGHIAGCEQRFDFFAYSRITSAKLAQAIGASFCGLLGDKRENVFNFCQSGTFISVPSAIRTQVLSKLKRDASIKQDFRQ